METCTKLYGPLLVALLLLAIAIFYHLPSGKTIDYTVPVIGIVIPLSSNLALKVLLVVAGLGSLCGYAKINYASLFPEHLTMQVFHDQEGIDRALKELAPFSIPKLVESANLKSAEQKYFDTLDREISKSLPIQKFFTAGSNDISSEGESHTVVEVSEEGLQRYHVATSEGELTHKLSRPGAASLTLVTKNKKIDSGYDYLKFGPINLIHGLLLMTKYGQTLVSRGIDPNVEYDVGLVAATKVSVFPWPDISNTVYLAEQDDRLVPIAYAVFH